MRRHLSLSFLHPHWHTRAAPADTDKRRPLPCTSPSAPPQGQRRQLRIPGRRRDHREEESFCTLLPSSTLPSSLLLPPLSTLSRSLFPSLFSSPLSLSLLPRPGQSPVVLRPSPAAVHLSLSSSAALLPCRLRIPLLSAPSRSHTRTRALSLSPPPSLSFTACRKRWHRRRGELRRPPPPQTMSTTCHRQEGEASPLVDRRNARRHASRAPDPPTTRELSAGPQAPGRRERLSRDASPAGQLFPQPSTLNPPPRRNTLTRKLNKAKVSLSAGAAEGYENLTKDGTARKDYQNLQKGGPPCRGARPPACPDSLHLGLPAHHRPHPTDAQPPQAELASGPPPPRPDKPKKLVRPAGRAAPCEDAACCRRARRVLVLSSSPPRAVYVHSATSIAILRPATSSFPVSAAATDDAQRSAAATTAFKGKRGGGHSPIQVGNVSPTTAAPCRRRTWPMCSLLSTAPRAGALFPPLPSATPRRRHPAASPRPFPLQHLPRRVDKG